MRCNLFIYCNSYCKLRDFGIVSFIAFNCVWGVLSVVLNKVSFIFL
ncbi:hypothetical protein HMPREF3226_01970 [Prevotella corporis]|uniref:Uncharacterized protein n=1 Tax=Prevotella corporis TaxID=28128 RepID=A0A133PZ37_9BACT|nr:hypothetical protein HMPREF3226_01970 [Prevotella corporis]